MCFCRGTLRGRNTATDDASENIHAITRDLKWPSQDIK